MFSRGWQAAVLLAAAGTIVGCSKAKKPWETVYPVSGVVSLEGQPVPNASVRLFPQSPDFPDTIRPTATTKEDGTFEIGTHSKSDGAPAGEYKAVVIRYTVVGPPESPSPGPNDLPEKYAAKDTTDLQVRVETKDTKVPLELKTN